MSKPCVLTNRKCEYFPCHRTDAEVFNCLFCYCPLYFDPDCPGSPEYIQVRGGRVKDCSGCDFPHRAENYQEVVRRLAALLLGRGAAHRSL
ncbi:MAG: hypothetical protein Kow0025_25530 [Thermodesulfovibrionales bacterium]